MKTVQVHLIIWTTLNLDVTFRTMKSQSVQKSENDLFNVQNVIKHGYLQNKCQRELKCESKNYLCVMQCFVHRISSFKCRSVYLILGF